jgi:hypothetical protein
MTMWARIWEKLKGWKTLIWNFFVVAILPLGLFATTEAMSIDWKGQFSPLAAYAILVAIKAVDTWLRLITTGPVGSKGEEPATPDIKAGD